MEVAELWDMLNYGRCWTMGYVELWDML